MSDTLLRRLCDAYDQDMEVIKRYHDAIDVMLMRDRMRSKMTKFMKTDYKWWRMDSLYLADVITCGVLGSDCLPVRAFAGVTHVTQTTPENNEYCIEFRLDGLDMTGNIHITLMDGVIYIIYHVTYVMEDYTTLWSVPYDVILEDKGLS